MKFIRLSTSVSPSPVSSSSTEKDSALSAWMA